MDKLLSRGKNLGSNFYNLFRIRARLPARTTRRSLILAVLVLLAAACLPAGPLWGQALTPTRPVLPDTATVPPIESATPVAIPPGTTPPSTPTPEPAIRHVIILSLDGLRPDAIEAAGMTHLIALMETGAYSLSARTIHPSSTLPSHTSMLTGMCPAGHGVTWNDYLPDRGYARGTDLFDLAHAAGLQTVMVVGKEKLRQISEPASVDIFRYINDRDSVIMDELLADFPDHFGLLFIHFPTADMMGHVYGWLSSQQLSVLFRADQALGRLLEALDARGLRQSTLIIVTADHGGHGTTHGTTLAEDMTIPWIIAGPGVRPGRLTAPIVTMDTAATAAFALGLPLPPEWDGRPVTEAFGIPVPLEEAIPCR